VLICREVAAIAPAITVSPGGTADWDGRFRVRLSADAGAGWTVGALGDAGWREIKAAVDPDESHTIPHPARLGLPALRRAGRVVAVPHLGFRAPEISGTTRAAAKIEPAPPEPMTKARFFIASGAE